MQGELEKIYVLVINRKIISLHDYKDITNNLLRAVCILVIITQSQQSDVENDIDQDHLKLYPYCGKLFGYASNAVKSRVVNSKDSQTQYPWVVLLYIKRRKKDYTWEEEECSGTVITEK